MVYNDFAADEIIYRNNFSKEEILDIVSNYYRDKEGREVTANVSIGKLRGQAPYMQPTYVLNYEIKEKVVLPTGEEKLVSIPAGNEEFERAISSKLEEEGVNVTTIDFKTAATPNGVDFVGASVVGERASLKFAKK